MMRKLCLLMWLAWTPLQHASDLESDESQLRHLKTVLAAGYPGMWRCWTVCCTFELIDDSGRRSTRAGTDWIAAMSGTQVIQYRSATAHLRRAPSLPGAECQRKLSLL
jgi:hypothetical protein